MKNVERRKRKLKKHVINYSNTYGTYIVCKHLTLRNGSKCFEDY